MGKVPLFKNPVLPSPWTSFAPKTFVPKKNLKIQKDNENNNIPKCSDIDASSFAINFPYLKLGFAARSGYFEVLYKTVKRELYESDRLMKIQTNPTPISPQEHQVKSRFEHELQPSFQRNVIPCSMKAPLPVASTNSSVEVIDITNDGVDTRKNENQIKQVRYGKSAGRKQKLPKMFVKVVPESNPLNDKGVTMDDSADFKASLSFVNIYHDTYENIRNYNFVITDLSTVIDILQDNDNQFFLFYLHYHDDPFSTDFCNFLQEDEVILEAYRNQNIVLYAWDISNADCLNELVESFAKYFTFQMVDIFFSKKSVAFAIASYNREPVIVEKVYSRGDLIFLRELLLEKGDTKPPTSYEFLKSIENLMSNEYTSYEREDHKELKANIMYGLYGPPIDVEEEFKNKSSNEKKMIRNRIKNQNEEVEAMFNTILKTNNKYCKWNGRVVLKIIYVCLETLPKEKEEKAKRFAKEGRDYHPNSDFVPCPVFILRKCKCKNSPLKACRIIIDTQRRVYATWADFLDYNKYPPCKIIYPTDGRYLPHDGVESTIYCCKLSPACDPLKKAINVTDVAAGVSGLVAGGVSIVGTLTSAVPFIAAAAPIALPIAAAVGIGSGIYAIGRNIRILLDREEHQQNMNLTNAECRAAYLNIAGGVMSFGMIGAMNTVSFLAGKGYQFGMGTKCILYGSNGVNLTIGGIGIGNAIHQVIKSKTKSPLVIVQLSAAILFFAHSVYTFKNISTIIEESQKRHLSEIELSIRSNRQRGAFNNMLKESITKETKQGISSIHKLNDVDSVKEMLTSSDKFNGEIIRTIDDQVLVNGRPVDLLNLGSLAKSDETFLNKSPSIPENLAPNVRSSIISDVQKWVIGLNICSELGKHLSNKDYNQIVDIILSTFEKPARDYILKMTKRLFNKMNPDILNALTNEISDGFVKLLKWACQQLVDNELFRKVCNERTSTEYLTEVEVDEVINILEDNLYSSFINYEYDTKIKKTRKEKRRVGNRMKTKLSCVCGGYYYN